MSEEAKREEIVRLILRLIERIEDERTLRMIYSYIDRQYCEQ